jgi:hypothetical protein
MLRESMKSIFPILAAAVCLLPAACERPPADAATSRVLDSRPWSTELAREVVLTPTTNIDESHAVKCVTNNAGDRALIVDAPHDSADHQIQHVFIVTGGRVYRVDHLPLEWRPITDICWLDARHVTFDRWSTPHYKMHYTIDVRALKLVDATPIDDH